jgi:hypothetical protein
MTFPEQPITTSSMEARPKHSAVLLLLWLPQACKPHQAGILAAA